MDPSTDVEPEYYLEWRKTMQRSLHIPAIKSQSAGAVLGGDYWICGGKGADQYSDVWRFSSQSLEWERLDIQGNEVPPPRDGHSMTKISDTKFIVYGGQGHLLDTGSRERGTENGKVKYLVMRKLHDDMYQFDCETLTWTFMPRLKVRPLARRGHIMKYLKPGTSWKGHIIPVADDEAPPPQGLGHLLLFGGSCLDVSTGFEKAANDVWLYSLDSQTWEEITCDGAVPHPLYGHAAELVGDRLIVIGGLMVPKRDFGGKGDKVPKKRRGDDSTVARPAAGMAAAELEKLGSNSVYVLNLSTFSWTLVSVDVSSLPPGFSGRGLNLIGHSVVPSAMNKDELYIFGGRRNDEKAFGMTRKDEKIPANLLALNTENMKLSVIEVANPISDNLNLPDARVNQCCLSLLLQTVQLVEEKAEDKTPKKGKASRRSPVIPTRRPPLQPHPVMRVYGGSSLYSPGFCSGTMYDLYFVPVEKKDLLSRAEASRLKDESSSSSVVQESLDKIQSARPPPVRKMSTMEIAIAAQNESNSGEVFRMLDLKPDSTVKLLSPSQGVSGQYFNLKTSLSRSRSTFSRPGTAHATSPQLPELKTPSARRPHTSPGLSASLGSMSLLEGSLDGTTVGGDADPVGGGGSLASNATGLTAKSKVRMERERLRQMAMTLGPAVKGLTYHDARDVFHHVFPSPAERRDFNIRTFHE